MVITKEWIHAHKTAGGAWNRKQMVALGVFWPQPKGWVKRLEGKEISVIVKYEFERHAGSKPALSKIDDLERRVAELERIVGMINATY